MCTGMLFLGVLSYTHFIKIKEIKLKIFAAPMLSTRRVSKSQIFEVVNLVIIPYRYSGATPFAGRYRLINDIWINCYDTIL